MPPPAGRTNERSAHHAMRQVTGARRHWAIEEGTDTSASAFDTELLARRTERRTARSNRLFPAEPRSTALLLIAFGRLAGEFDATLLVDRNHLHPDDVA